MAKYTPRPRPDPTTLQGMLTEGGESLVGYLRSIGYRGIVLTQTLQRTFTSAGARSIQALVNYYNRSTAAAQAAQAAPSSQPIATPTGTGNADIASRVRYSISVPYTVSGQERRSVFVQIDQNTRLSRDQLQELVDELIAGASLEGALASPGFPIGVTQTGPIKILRVEKGVS